LAMKKISPKKPDFIRFFAFLSSIIKLNSNILKEIEVKVESCWGELQPSKNNKEQTKEIK